MNRVTERRRYPREALPTPEIGIFYPLYDQETQEPAGEHRYDTLLAHILNWSEGGILLESFMKLEVGSPIDIRLHMPHEKAWMAYKGEVAWATRGTGKIAEHVVGIKFRKAAPHQELPRRPGQIAKKRMYPSDLEFLVSTSLFDAVSQEAQCPLLNTMIPERVEAGQRIISQGDHGECFYIIQHGSCIVSVEKDGSLHPVARLRAGEIVGEMAIFTGEPRKAHVDAETDMTLWRVSKTDFDALCSKHEDLRDFLTDLVAHRFSSERVTAERTVGKYVVNEIIGRGGWSIVYKGVHTRLNMPVAVKMLKHDLAMNPYFSERFRCEAKIIAGFNHENIVKVYDIEQLYRTIFIVMEYLEGMPLDYILERMPKLSLARSVDILLQASSGLDYAHSKGIIHQDIKPANIFVQIHDVVKLVDFGLACTPERSNSCLRGTIFYGSPEQLRGDAVDERTDIYSLGLTAFEMITGRKPFAERDINEMIDLRLHEDVPDPRIFVPDLPDELHAFLVGCTQRDLGSRYKNISQAQSELLPLAVKLGIEPRRRRIQQRKMMSVLLFYGNESQADVNRLVEDLGCEIRKTGAVLKAADFRDIP